MKFLRNVLITVITGWNIITFVGVYRICDKNPNTKFRVKNIIGVLGYPGAVMGCYLGKKYE